jgi:lysophospholipase L1-like esterase
MSLRSPAQRSPVRSAGAACRRVWLWFGLLLTTSFLLGNEAARPDAAAPFANVAWHNVGEIVPVPASDGGGFRLQRVPAAVREHLNPAAQKGSACPAGVELRFNLVGAQAKVILCYVDARSAHRRTAPVFVEVRQGDFLVRTVVLHEEWTEVLIERPKLEALLVAGAARERVGFDAGLVRVVFPHGVEVRVQAIEGDVAPPRADQVPARRLLAYGSSITQGYDSVRPGDPYPARLARMLRVDALNLGFGSGAFLEPQMADWIAARSDWDFAVLELGVNLLSRVPADEFRSRVRYFLTRIAAAHPTKRIWVVDQFLSFRDLNGSAKQAEFRTIVREVVAELALPEVRHIDGRSLLTEPTGLGADLLHPSPEGFAEIARNLALRMLSGASEAAAAPSAR